LVLKEEFQSFSHNPDQFFPVDFWLF